MSGVYIPGMIFPDRCDRCRLAYDDGMYYICPFTRSGSVTKPRPANCPLIDATKLEKEFEKRTGLPPVWV